MLFRSPGGREEEEMQGARRRARLERPVGRRGAGDGEVGEEAAVVEVRCVLREKHERWRGRREGWGHGEEKKKKKRRERKERRRKRGTGKKKKERGGRTCSRNPEKGGGWLQDAGGRNRKRPGQD